jgi:hypothetical protein
MAISRLYRFYYVKFKLAPPTDSKFDEPGLIEVLAGFSQRTIEEVQKDFDDYRESRGARLGDTNALKHGFYSSAFKPDEIRRLDLADQSEIVDEISLLRTLNKRLLISMGDVSKLERLDQLRALRVITFSCICIERLENLLIRVSKIPLSEDDFVRKKIFETMKAYGDAHHLGDRFDETKRTRTVNSSKE